MILAYRTSIFYTKILLCPVLLALYFLSVWIQTVFFVILKAKNV